MSERKYSIDSQQNHSTEQSQKSKYNKLGIKKRTLKRQIPFQILGADNQSDTDKLNKTEIIEQNMGFTSMQIQQDQLNNSLSYNASQTKNNQQNSQFLLDIKNIDAQNNSNLNLSQPQKFKNKNDYMSFTENSDSDYSQLDSIKKQRLLLSGIQKTTNSQKDSQQNSEVESQKYKIIQFNQLNIDQQQHRIQTQQLLIQQSQYYQQINQSENETNEVKRKFYHHPFANQPSPFDELKQAITISIETIYYFIMFSIIGNILNLISEIIIRVLLSIIGAFGLTYEFFRTKIKNCRKNKEEGVKIDKKKLNQKKNK